MFGRKANEGKMEEQLRQLGAKIDELVEKEKKAYPKQVEYLRMKQEQAKKALNELSEASDDAWESIKKGAEKTMDELKTAWDSASSKFKK